PGLLPVGLGPFGLLVERHHLEDLELADAGWDLDRDLVADLASGKAPSDRRADRDLPLVGVDIVVHDEGVADLGTGLDVCENHLRAQADAVLGDQLDVEAAQLPETLVELP